MSPSVPGRMWPDLPSLGFRLREHREAAGGEARQRLPTASSPQPLNGAPFACSTSELLRRARDPAWKR